MGWRMSLFQCDTIKQHAAGVHAFEILSYNRDQYEHHHGVCKAAVFEPLLTELHIDCGV